MIEPITPPPVKEPIYGAVSASWAHFFNKLYRNLLSIAPSVSADNGDASVTLTALQSAGTQLFGTALTANRTVTLSSVNAFSGAKKRVVRQASATGAFNIDVGPGLKTLSAAGTWAEVEYTGSAWILTAAGSL